MENKLGKNTKFNIYWLNLVFYIVAQKKSFFKNKLYNIDKFMCLLKSPRIQLICCI